MFWFVIGTLAQWAIEVPWDAPFWVPAIIGMTAALIIVILDRRDRLDHYAYIESIVMQGKVVDDKN